jgi:phenylacetate-CoA ligase
MFNKELETMPLEQLRKLQSERLRSLVQRVYQQVPAYRTKLDEKGVTPADIRDIQDIHQLPFTYKTDLRDNYPFGLFAVPQNEVIRLHCSSGTTGKPIVVGYTRHDLDVFSEVVARSLAAAGGQPGMKIQNAYGYGLFTGGLGLHYGAEQLGLCVIPISGGQTDKQLMLLQDFQAEMICCTPSYALTLAETMKARGINPASLNLKYAVLGAEPWTEAIRHQIEKELNVKATNIYGLSEVIGPGVSIEAWDEQGTGSYIWEDHFFPEIVDRHTGEPLPEGEEGVLVFTTLTKEAMPVLRYWTNDITSIYYDKQGSRTHIKMAPIKGRADDMLIIRGVNLFHTQVEAVIDQFSQLTPNYQLVVSRTGSMDEVMVKVEVSEQYVTGWELTDCDEPTWNAHDQVTLTIKALSKKIKDQVGLSMRIVLEKPGSIARSEGGKLNRILDLRK